MRRTSRIAKILAVVSLAALATPSIAADGPLTDQERKLMGIAASCAAFYQSAMFELDLPVEGNGPKRQTFIDVFYAFAKRGRTAREVDADFQRYIIGRTVEVSTIIQQDPQKAGPKVMENLPKCDAYIEEMKAAAGIE